MFRSLKISPHKALSCFVRPECEFLVKTVSAHERSLFWILASALDNNKYNHNYLWSKSVTYASNDWEIFSVAFSVGVPLKYYHKRAIELWVGLFDSEVKTSAPCAMHEVHILFYLWYCGKTTTKKPENSEVGLVFLMDNFMEHVP